MRMQCIPCHGNCLRPCDHRIKRHPFNRTTAFFQRRCIRLVNGQANRHFAGGHKLGKQNMTFAHIGTHFSKPAHECRAAFIAHGLQHRRHPVSIGRLDADLAFPFWIEESLIGFGEIFAFDDVGVIGNAVNRHPVRCPLVVSR